MRHKDIRIVLASASPRRRELLEQIGLAFEVRVSEAEEDIGNLPPDRTVEELALRKAQAVLALLEREEAGGMAEQDLLVIGADTVVARAGEILGKPQSQKDAAGMLRRLSGQTHEVYTGVALLYCPASPRISVQRRIFHEKTCVTFYPLTEAEIGGYVASGDCMDKAGAYGIQGLFARYVRCIEGDYNNVVGLPAGRLYQEAKEWLTS